MRSQTICVFIAILLQHAVVAQRLGPAACKRLAGGCDAGKKHSAALQRAIGQFNSSLLYGGSDQIIFSSALSGTVLAQVAYSCLSGSSPPEVNGSFIKEGLSRVAECGDQCGSMAINDDCGLGVLIVADAAKEPCFSRAFDVRPSGRCCAPPPLPSPPPSPSPSESPPPPPVTTTPPPSSPLPTDLAVVIVAVDQAAAPAAVAAGAAGSLLSLLRQGGSAGEAALQAATSALEASAKTLAAQLKKGLEDFARLALRAKLIDFKLYLDIVRVIQLVVTASNIKIAITGVFFTAVAVSIVDLIQWAQRSLSRIQDDLKRKPGPSPSETSSADGPCQTGCSSCRWGAYDPPPDDVDNGGFEFGLPASALLGFSAGRGASQAGNKGTITRRLELERRADDIYDTCGGALQLQRLPYPSTSKGGSTRPSDANNIPAISKWWDTIAPTSQQLNWPCDWALARLPNPQTPFATDPTEYALNGRRQSATEHIYENHFVATFIDWLALGDGGPGAISCGQGFGNVPSIDATINILVNDPTSPFHNFTAAQLMMGALTWYDPSTGVGSLAEFYILQSGINSLKNKILPRPINPGWNEGYLPSPVADLSHLLYMARDASLAVEYINTAAVANVFDTVRLRQRHVLSLMDQDSHNIPPPPDNPYSTTWAGLYDMWLRQYLFQREMELQAWLQTLRTAITTAAGLAVAAGNPAAAGTIPWLTQRMGPGQRLSDGFFCFLALDARGMFPSLCHM